MFSKGSASPVTPQERKLLFTGSLNIPNGNNNNRKRESEPDKESEDKTNKEQKKPNPQQRPEETTAQKLFKWAVLLGLTYKFLEGTFDLIRMAAEKSKKK